jgi:hypothetical protein
MMLTNEMDIDVSLLLVVNNFSLVAFFQPIV